MITSWTQSHFLISKPLSSYGKILLFDCILFPFSGHFRGFYSSSYLQCTTSSESLFNSYNLMASFSSSWQDMVHGSPEMNKQANKWHFFVSHKVRRRKYAQWKCSSGIWPWLFKSISSRSISIRETTIHWMDIYPVNNLTTFQTTRRWLKNNKSKPLFNSDTFLAICKFFQPN